MYAPGPLLLHTRNYSSRFWCVYLGVAAGLGVAVGSEDAAVTRMETGVGVGGVIALQSMRSPGSH
jgi:hypothetical protein